MKKILVVVAALLVALAVVANDPGGVATIGSAESLSSTAGSGHAGGSLASLPPLVNIASQYGGDRGPNNCNIWEGDGDYHNLGWHFKTADVSLPSGLDLLFDPSPTGTIFLSGEPAKADLQHGWNYWWETGSTNDTILHSRLIIHSTDAQPGGLGGVNPCNGPTAFTFGLSGELLNDDTWFVNVFTAT